MKPRLLLVDEDATWRLRLVGALSSSFEVFPVSHGDDPVKLARLHRPDIALIAVHHTRPEASLRLCRILRTDVRPIGKLALYDDRLPFFRIHEVQNQGIVDGYLAPVTTGEEVVELAAAVWRGEHPFLQRGDPAVGPLGRLWRRVVRTTG